jgi:hypothetical protein
LWANFATGFRFGISSKPLVFLRFFIAFLLLRLDLLVTSH